jgi:putative transposase
MARRRKPEQLMLEMNTWGGARDGAGCKPAGDRAELPHARREVGRPSQPLHVTLRMRSDVPSLRAPAPWQAILAVLRAIREREGFRVVHYSVMTNHIHLLVEADGAEQFFDAMKALLTRLALRLNAAFCRKGRLFDDRYHSHVLETLAEVRNAILYILLNARKHAAEHGQRYAPGWLDPYSSAAAFEGWSGPIVPSSADLGTSSPQTWYLRTGWRNGGAMDPSMIPGGAPRRARTTCKAA